jgi:hypothetical protein
VRSPEKRRLHLTYFLAGLKTFIVSTVHCVL